jgi:di/tricarboxylate transporter
MISAAFAPYFVLLVVAATFIIVYNDWTKPSIAFASAGLVFILTDILTPKQALSGFANESIASIVMLILITAGLKTSFNMEGFLDRLFKTCRTYQSFLWRMMGLVAGMSTTVNNTPIVVMMTPYVFNWGKRNKISPSKLLIPLSFATILGGMITLIGTSTTLVLNGFMVHEGLGGLNLLHLFLIGLAVSIAGLVFLALFSKKLLPDRPDLIENFQLNRREYLVEKRLKQGSPLIGKTVADGGLRNLTGVYLVEILRDNRLISPVDPKEVILPNDVLFFAGNTKNIMDLSSSKLKLELPKTGSELERTSLQIIEAVISSNSSLIGKSVKESEFRNRYDAAVVAIHRNGEKLSGKIGSVKLKAGDALLLYAGKDFTIRADLYRDLYIVSEERKQPPLPASKDIQLLGLLLVALTLLLTGWFSLFASLLILVTLMVMLKMITLQHAKRDIDISMMIVLVFSLAMGEAMIHTGAGEMVASAMMRILVPYGSLAVLIGLMLITTLLTSFVTNVGAVAIAFPIALSATESMGIQEADAFYLGIAFAASAAFLTPVGYQTNLIVYGPGGYTFKDFMRIGLPMVILYLTIVILGILCLYPQLLG